MLADISRGSALPAGLWAKGFAGETVKGSRCWSTFKAGPQSMLGTAQAVLVLVSGQRREKRDSGWAGKGRGGMSHLQTSPTSRMRSGERGRGAGSRSARSGDCGTLGAICCQVMGASQVGQPQMTSGTFSVA